MANLLNFYKEVNFENLFYQMKDDLLQDFPVYLLK